MQGFAVLPDGDSEPYVLRYGEIPGLAAQGFTIDHADLAAGLAAALARLPHVRVESGARVTGVDLHHPDFAAVDHHPGRPGDRDPDAARSSRPTERAPRPGRWAASATSGPGSPTWPGTSCGASRSRTRASPACSWAARRPRSPTRIGDSTVRLDVRRAGEPPRHPGAEPGRGVLPGASRAVPERGEGGPDVPAGARVGQLLDPAGGGVPRPPRPGRGRRRLLPSAHRHGPHRVHAGRDPPPAGASRDRRRARRRAALRAASRRARSGRAWRWRNRCTARSASRRPRCGSCAMGSSGSGAGAAAGERPRWPFSRPTRGGCR